MSAESRRRKAALKRAAVQSSSDPKIWVVVSFDTYMGDMDDSPSFGYSGVNDIFGPFTEAEANAFRHERESLDEFATEYSVRRLASG